MSVKIPRTVYFDHTEKLYVSFYINKKGKTVIDKKGKKLTDVVKTGSKKGYSDRLSKEHIHEYDYIIENKKSHRFDHIESFSRAQEKLDKILNKKKLTEKDKQFLHGATDNIFFESKIADINKKLGIKDVKHQKTGEHIIKNVAVFKYSKSGVYIPSKQHESLKRILSNRTKKIQLTFHIGDEKFFTPYFKPTPTKNYEKMFNNIVSKYPSKIKWNVTDIKIEIKE